jgi:hypothetical protein
VVLKSGTREQMERLRQDRSNFPNIEMLFAPALDVYAMEPRFQELFRRLRLASRTLVIRALQTSLDSLEFRGYVTPRVLLYQSTFDWREP